MTCAVTLEQLRTFQAVARLGSFSDAARQLHLTQPSVSARIRSLEAEIGAPLFRRRESGVELTRRGRRYMEFVDRAVYLLDEAQDTVASTSARQPAALRVGAPSSLVKFALPPAVAAFFRLRPDVRLQVFTGTTSTLVQWLHSGSVDVIFSRFLPDAPHTALVADVPEPLLAVVRPDHPVCRGASPDGFASVVLSFRRHWAPQAEADEPVPRAEAATFEVDNISTAKLLVSKGSAIGLLPAAAVLVELRGGTLLALPSRSTAGAVRSLFAVAAAHVAQAAAVADLVECIRSATARLGAVDEFPPRMVPVRAAAT